MSAAPLFSCIGVLILLFSMFITGSESAAPTVKVKLHESATLPCSKRCPGEVTWTALQKPTEVLAKCDQTSCRSVKEGYQMIHDQYLKGNFSLTITDADLSKTGLYTCYCGRSSDLCDVELQVEHCPACVCPDLAVAVAVLLPAFAVAVWMVYRLKSENQQLRRRLEGNGDTNHVQNGGDDDAQERQRLTQLNTEQEV